MLKADFSEQNEDEWEAPLQPRDYCLQLGQGRGWCGLFFLGLVPRAVPLRAGRRGGLLEQRGGPVLQGLVMEVVVMVMVVVLGRSREERSALCAVGAPFFSGGRSHLDKNLGWRAQD